MAAGSGDPAWCSNLPASRIAVIAALALEARIAAAGTAGPRVYVSGPGAERAFAVARTAIGDGAAALISWGLAGGLNPEASTGTVMLPQVLASAAGEWHTDAAWRQRMTRLLRPAFRVIDAPLFTADSVLTTSAAKAELAAESGASAVDMESAGVAAAARDAGLPFVALRVVADGALDALPDNVESLVTDDGRTRLIGLAGCIASPRRIRLLVALASQSSRARSVLRRVAQCLAQPSQ